MDYTIAKLKDDIQRKTHGTSLNKIQDIDGLINEASRNFLADVDPAETIRIEELATNLETDVYDYVLPVDLKGNKIIDIRPAEDRGIADKFSQTYSEAFDLRKSDGTFNIEYNSGVKTIRIAKTILASSDQNPFSVVYYSKYIFRDSSGTWKEEQDDDTDIVNLDTDSYNLLLDKCMMIVAVQIAGIDSSYDYKITDNKYQITLARYKGNNKSQIKQPRVNYYNMK